MGLTFERFEKYELGVLCVAAAGVVKNLIDWLKTKCAILKDITYIYIFIYIYVYIYIFI